MPVVGLLCAGAEPIVTVSWVERFVTPAMATMIGLDDAVVIISPGGHGHLHLSLASLARFALFLQRLGNGLLVALPVLARRVLLTVATSVARWNFKSVYQPPLAIAHRDTTALNSISRVAGCAG